MLIKTALVFVVVVSSVACGSKKEAGGDKLGTTETKPTEAKPTEAKPTEAKVDKPSGPVDAAALAGTWAMVDRPEIVWTFNADGTTHIKTSVTEFPGTFELKGNALSMKGKDVAGVNRYEVLEVTANKLKLKDADSSTLREFKK